MEIKKLGIAAFAKVLAVPSGLWGLFLGALFTLASLAGDPSELSESGQAPPTWLRFLFQAGVLVFPVLSVLGGALTGALTAWLFNLATVRVGGMRTTPVPAPRGDWEIRRFEVFSSAKVIGVVLLGHTVLWLVITPIMLVFTTADPTARAGLPFALPLTLVSVIANQATAFAMYVIGILFYNFCAGKWGGLEVTLDPCSAAQTGGEVRVNRFMVGSVARLHAYLAVAALPIFVPIALLALLAVLATAGDQVFLLLFLLLVVLAVLIPLGVGMAWVAGALVALVYNAAASLGVRLRMEVDSSAPAAPAPISSS